MDVSNPKSNSERIVHSMVAVGYFVDIDDNYYIIYNDNSHRQCFEEIESFKKDLEMGYFLIPKEDGWAWEEN